MVAETDKDLQLVDINREKVHSKKVKCVVLGVDWEAKVVEISTDQDLVQSASKQQNTSREFRTGDSVAVNTLLVKDKYLVGTVVDTSCFVLIMTADWHKPYSQLDLEYQAGSTATATVLHTSASSGIPFYANLPITTLSDPVQKRSLVPQMVMNTEQSTVGHLKIGKTMPFKIVNISATEMIVEPVSADKSFENTKAIVHVSSIPICSKQLEELLTEQIHPFNDFILGQIITCKVLHTRMLSM